MFQPRYDFLPRVIIRQYHRISALPFFRQYSQWKSFAEWKSFVRIRKRAKCRAVLEEDLFTLHPWLRIGKPRNFRLCHLQREDRRSIQHQHSERIRLYHQVENWQALIKRHYPDRRSNPPRVQGYVD